MRIDLNDKVALVTGSARRVGKVIALELAKQGVNILLHYHRAEAADVRDTLQEIKSYGVDAHGVAADISQVEGVDTLFEALQRPLRSIRHGGQQRLSIPKAGAARSFARGLGPDDGGQLARVIPDHAAGSAPHGGESDRGWCHRQYLRSRS